MALPTKIDPMLGYLTTGEAFLFKFAVFLGELEVAFREGEACADCHFIAIEALAERFDESIGTLVDDDGMQLSFTG